MALTKVTGGTISTTSDYQINNIVGVAGTFTTLNVSGVLTYEDVTNIESVGVSTFKDDVQFHGSGAGISSVFWDKSANEFKFKDNVKLSFGDSQDLHISHIGTKSYIKDTGTGSLRICSDDLRVYNAADNEYLIRAVQDTGVSLYDGANTVRLATNGSGAVVTGILTATTFSGTLSGGLPITNGADNRVITASSSSAIQGESNLTFDGNNLAMSGTGVFTITRNSRTLTLEGNYGNEGHPAIKTSSGHNLRIFTSGNNERLRITSGGDVEIDGTAAGVSSVTWDASANSLIFNDDSYAKFGDGSDLQIYHDSSNGNSHINESGSGSLVIKATNTYINSSADESMIAATADGAVDLYHNGTKTFYTEANGAIVQGPDGGDGWLKIYADDGDDNADLWRIRASQSSSEFTLQNANNGSSWDTNILAVGDGKLELYYDSSPKLETTSTGVKITSNAANTSKLIVGNTASRGLEITTVSDGSNNDAQVVFNAADTTSSGYHANLVFQLADVEKARFHGNGDYFQLSSTCTGITFNGDYAAVNQLNDYEEGTWTPNIGTTSGATATGEYRKIGKAVFIQMYVSIPSHSNSSTMSIAGLPFSAMSGKYSSFVIGNFRFFNHDGGYTTLRVNQAGTTMTFRETGDSQAWQNAEWSQVQSDFAMYVSGTYFTD